MIVPLQLLQVTLQGAHVQLKAIAPSDFVWASGASVEMGIPHHDLVPHASRRAVLASDSAEGVVEWLFAYDDSTFIHHVLSMTSGELIYCKPLSEGLHFPDHGVWIAVKDAVSVMRGSAIRYQNSAQDIVMVMYQTNKAYFADITRVAGQNPAFSIHVADGFEALMSLLFLQQDQPMTFIGAPHELTLLRRAADEWGLDAARCQYLSLDQE